MQFGFDRPIHIQYFTFVKQAFKGDLGDSSQYRQESLTLVLGRLPSTLPRAAGSIRGAHFSGKIQTPYASR